jgi:hypothetical protein
MSELINNSEQRIEALKQIISGLHRGEPVDQVKEKLRTLVQQASGSEIAAMEQRLIAEGMSVDEIRGMCDLHSQVLRESVEPAPLGRRPEPGHPLDTFRRENRAITGAAADLRAVLGEVRALAPGAELGELLPRWRAASESLLEVDKHYARKENLLFPHLERHDVTGPSQVMWAKDDEVRARLRALRSALAEDDLDVARAHVIADELGVPALAAVLEMIDKEERVLLPLSQEKLDEEQWAAIWRESPRFGFCLVEPAEGYAPAETVGAAPAGLTEGRIDLGHGSVSVAQLQGLLRILPVDLTFVDADDRVAFFSEGDRIFERPPSVIGRRVQHCHPPKSLDTVERIVSDFRAGRQDKAEFWIQLHGRFVHIRYFAVRDEGGEYLGTLEVTQDLAPLRALEGERRLLSYDEPAA